MALSTQLQNINDYIHKNFIDLSEEQLNWKPSSASWSIAQCLDHLIVNNTNYFKTFDALMNDTFHSTFWQRFSPFTNWFGKKLLEFTAAVPQKKVKAPASFLPSKSLLDKNITQRFLQQQEKLLQYFNKLEPLSKSKRIIISSPVSNLITFNLDTLLLAFANHEQRHINQAKKILNHLQFPKA